jgi:hypothetical protein
MTNELSSSLSWGSVNIEFYYELLSDLPVHLEISFEVSSSGLLKRANQTYCHHPRRRTTVEEQGQQIQELPSIIWGPYVSTTFT